MNKNLTKIIAAGTLFFALLIGINIVALDRPDAKLDQSCVTVYVDYNSLSSNAISSFCISISETVSAREVLSEAGYDIVGTQKYPDAIVCRVNGMPSLKKEKCIDMPPADAYWAVLINEGGKWEMAQVGISDITLKAGQGVGLVYANNGKVKLPN